MTRQTLTEWLEGREKRDRESFVSLIVWNAVSSPFIVVRLVPHTALFPSVVVPDQEP